MRKHAELPRRQRLQQHQLLRFLSGRLCVRGPDSSADCCADEHTHSRAHSRAIYCGAQLHAHRLADWHTHGHAHCRPHRLPDSNAYRGTDQHPDHCAHCSTDLALCEPDQRP